jgi:PPM family protein phosphatase
VLSVLWGGASDAGSVRAHNEDSMLCDRPIFAVADGMGGGPAGEQASAIAVAALRRCAGVTAIRTEAVLAAVNRANDEILGAAEREVAHRGMGTTVVGLALVTDGDVEHWLAFNVGDSRLYRLAGSVFEQISVDHSEVQELIAAGMLAPEDRASHPQAHVITRVLGTAPAPEADCWLLYPVPGERFLLCSDGLIGELSDERIHALLGSAGTPENIARLLVDEAVRAGAADNVTAVVVEVAGAPGDEAATTGPRQRAG